MRVSAPCWLSAALLLGSSLPASVTYSGSSGSLAASATFTVVSGNTLTVKLTNTSTVDNLVPADVLTAVFFNIAGDTNLAIPTPGGGIVGALRDPGSTTEFASGLVCDSGPVGCDPSSADVGPEWAYRGDIAGGFAQNYGISSSGLTAPADFGPGDRFVTDRDYQKPASPDGLQYGILSAGDDPTTGNTNVTGKYALIKNSVTFTLLCGASCGFGESQISDVRFQYGTSLSEPFFMATPEPGFYGVLSLGLAGVIFAIRRRRAA